MRAHNLRIIRQTILLAALMIKPLSGQVTLRHSTTLRDGKLPQIQEERRGTLYSDLSLSYETTVNSIMLRTDIQIEGFRPADSDAQYLHILRRNLSAGWGWGQVTAGSIYQMFGQGLMLRGFELPGFIYEDAIYQTQQRIVRDIDGVALNLQRGPFKLDLLSGAPTINPLLPPELRKQEGTLQGMQFEVRLPRDLSAGVSYVDHDSDNRAEVAGITLGWTPGDFFTVAAQPFAVDIRFEYAEQIDAPDWRYVNDLPPHALFASGNLGWGPLGISLEYKDYLAFDLGFNDPPPLVRESSELLLNRATHVLMASNEQGYQVESYLSLPRNMILTANVSRGINEFSPLYKPAYQEYYLGLDWFADIWSGRLFVDNGLEEIFLQQDRWTVGLRVDRSLALGKAMGLDLQVQSFRRYLGGLNEGDEPLVDQPVATYYLALHLQNWYGLTVGAGLEQSNDPEFTDDIIRYPSITLGWQPSYRFGATLFIGDRRRGTACDHGYCVEVLDFSGAELTVQWRL